jgi:hypothetical protein
MQQLWRPAPHPRAPFARPVQKNAVLLPTQRTRARTGQAPPKRGGKDTRAPRSTAMITHGCPDSAAEGTALRVTCTLTMRSPELTEIHAAAAARHSVEQLDAELGGGVVPEKRSSLGTFVRANMSLSGALRTVAGKTEQDSGHHQT